MATRKQGIRARMKKRRYRKEYRHSRESGNRCFLAAKPRKLGGFAARVK
jgi:hypothetical protein